MPKINGKIYYNNVTGNVLLVVNQNEGVWLKETTFEEDVATYPQLKEVNDDIISVIRLQWDQYKDDFAVSRPVKVLDGKVLWELFDDAPGTEPSKPISQQIKKIEDEKVILENRVTEMNLVMARSNAELFETMIMLIGG